MTFDELATSPVWFDHDIATKASTKIDLSMKYWSPSIGHIQAEIPESYEALVGNSIDNHVAILLMHEYSLSRGVTLHRAATLFLEDEEFRTKIHAYVDIVNEGYAEAWKGHDAKNSGDRSVPKNVVMH
jgi:hypothetical protein